MAVDSEEFKKLSEMIKNKTTSNSSFLTNLNDSQIVMVIKYLETDISIEGLHLKDLNETQIVLIIKNLETDAATKNLHLTELSLYEGRFTLTIKNLAANTTVKIYISGDSKKYKPDIKILMAIKNMLKTNRNLTLSLGNCWGGSDVIETFASEIKEGYPQGLSISVDNLNAKPLASALEGSHLRSLSLRVPSFLRPNEVDVVVEALVPALRRSHLQSLNLEIEKQLSFTKFFKAFVAVFEGNFLQFLAMIGEKLKDEGITILAPALKKSRLLHLMLNYNDIQYMGAKALASLLKEGCLMSLFLANNSINSRNWMGITSGSEALAIGLKGSYLRCLDLRGNNIGDVGFKALAAGIQESSLQVLSLSNNLIGVEGMKVFAPALKKSRLQRLYLSSNQIGSAGTKVLAAVLNECHLMELDLDGNAIDNMGAEALATGLKKSHLLILSLNNNDIGGRGIKALAAVLKESSLLKLLLNYNQIGKNSGEYNDGGIQALAAGLKGSPLLILTLSDNRISDDAQYLADAVKETHLRLLCLRESYAKDSEDYIKLKKPLQEIQTIMEPRQAELQEEISKILRRLKTLEFQFQPLVALSTNKTVAESSYAKQCKNLYIQVKRLLQRWEILYIIKKYNSFINDPNSPDVSSEQWLRILGKCLDIMPPAERDEIATLPFTWIEDEGLIFADSEIKEGKEFFETQAMKKTTPSYLPTAVFIQGDAHEKEKLKDQERITTVVSVSQELSSGSTFSLTSNLSPSVPLTSPIAETLLSIPFTPPAAPQKEPSHLPEKKQLEEQQQILVQNLSGFQEVLSKHKSILGETEHQLREVQESLPYVKGSVLKALQAQEKELLSILEKETLVQRRLQEQELILADPKLSDYYYVFQVQFNSIFIAAKAIHSEMIANDDSTAWGKAATGIQKVAQAFPVAGLIGEVLAGALNYLDYRAKKQAVNILANFFTGVAVAETAAEHLSRQLTLSKKIAILALNTGPKLGFVKRQIENFKKLKDAIQVNDLDTAIKKLADEDCKKILIEIMKGRFSPNPSLEALQGLLQVIMGPDFAYYSPYQTPVVSISQSSPIASTVVFTPVFQRGRSGTETKLKDEVQKLTALVVEQESQLKAQDKKDEIAAMRLKVDQHEKLTTLVEEQRQQLEAQRNQTKALEKKLQELADASGVSLGNGQQQQLQAKPSAHMAGASVDKQDLLLLMEHFKRLEVTIALHEDRLNESSKTIGRKKDK